MKRVESNNRLAKGRAREEARFTAAPSKTDLPDDYAATLRELKNRIAGERLRVVMSANAAMVLLYWDIGRTILQRQAKEGWGTKVIDRLSSDLRQTFPDMTGLSPRNLKYMRAFTEAWSGSPNCATGHCTIALASEYRPLGTLAGYRLPALVRHVQTLYGLTPAEKKLVEESVK